MIYEFTIHSGHVPRFLASDLDGVACSSLSLHASVRLWPRDMPPCDVIAASRDTTTTITQRTTLVLVVVCVGLGALLGAQIGAAFGGRSIPLLLQSVAASTSLTLSPRLKSEVASSKPAQRSTIPVATASNQSRYDGQRHAQVTRRHLLCV